MDSKKAVKGWGFPPRFYNNGKDIRFASDEENIRESLEVLLTTMLGERFQYPSYGCDLKKMMFEEITSDLITEVRGMIADSIYNYEPRVEILNIDVSESENDAHLLLINIDYFILETDSEQTMEFSFLLY